MQQPPRHMTEQRDARAYRRTNAAWGAVFGLVFVAGGLWIVSRAGDDHGLGLAFWMLLYAVAAALLGGLFFIARARRFRCPDCGGAVTTVDEWRDTEGEPDRRYCARCDILWRIGTR